MCLYCLNVFLVLTFSEEASTHPDSILKSSSLFSSMSSQNKHLPVRLKNNSRHLKESAQRSFSPDGLKSDILSSGWSWGGFHMSAQHDASESRCFNPADALPSAAFPSPNARGALDSPLSRSLSLTHTPLTSVSQPKMLHFLIEV